MVRYDIGGKEKEKVYEKITVRKIEYFGSEEDTPETEPEPGADNEATSNETETEAESTTDE